MMSKYVLATRYHFECSVFCININNCGRLEGDSRSAFNIECQSLIKKDYSVGAGATARML